MERSVSRAADILWRCSRFPAGWVLERVPGISSDFFIPGNMAKGPVLAKLPRIGLQGLSLTPQQDYEAEAAKLSKRGPLALTPHGD